VDKKVIITYNQKEQKDSNNIEVVSFWEYFGS
jgi:hypothetical protein